jgi:hypothetical protein
VSTLLDVRNSGNRKCGLGCAEAVEDEYSLWKEEEKTGKFPATDYADEHRSNSFDLQQRKGTTEAVP